MTTEANKVTPLNPASKVIGESDPLNLKTRDIVLKGDVLAIKFEAERMTSIISSTMISNGSIKTIEGCRIDGRHTGDIKAKTVLVMKDAIVSGHIEADKVIILGTVEGQITSHEQLVFAPTAKIKADVLYKQFATFFGHSFEGSMKRIA